jgi:hypothetical protein
MGLISVIWRVTKTLAQKMLVCLVQYFIKMATWAHTESSPLDPSPLVGAGSAEVVTFDMAGGLSRCGSLVGAYVGPLVGLSDRMLAGCWLKYG